MERHILIFGGSFNPPTRAHQAIITACLKLPRFSAVWVMPSGSRADKIITTSDKQRMDMLNILKKEVFNDNPRLVISDFELKLPRPTRLHRTVTELAKAYPDTTFWFAFGGDAYRSMQDWYGADTFMHGLRLVVFTEHDVPEHIMRIRLPKTFHEISSTQVREAIARGKDVQDWVDSHILDYIKHKNLFSSP